MSALGRLSTAVSNLTVRTWGATIRVVPVISNQYTGRSPDPDRFPATLSAIVSRQNVRADIEGARRGAQMQGATQMSSRTTRVFIRLADYDALGYSIRAKDVIEFLDRTGQASETFEVALPERTDTNDITLDLVTIEAE